MLLLWLCSCSLCTFTSIHSGCTGRTGMHGFMYQRGVIDTSNIYRSLWNLWKWGEPSQTGKFPWKKPRFQRNSFEMKWHVWFFKHFTEGLWKIMMVHIAGSQDGWNVTWWYKYWNMDFLFFMQSRCCRECNPAGILQLLQSTQPEQYQRVGQ